MGKAASSTGHNIVLFAIIFAVSIVLIFLFALWQSRRKEKARKEAARRTIEQNRRQRDKERSLAEEKQRKELEEYMKTEQPLKNLFKLPDADIWESYDLSTPFQKTRRKRSVEEARKMRILAYDPRYGMAKIRGTAGKCYLVSGAMCNCMDFHDTGLPCKHMYYLANDMTTRPKVMIEEKYEKGLDGFSAELLGRFSNKDDVIRLLYKRGCAISTGSSYSQYYSPIAIAGKTDAIKKIEKLHKLGIPVISYEVAQNIFTSQTPEQTGGVADES